VCFLLYFGQDVSTDVQNALLSNRAAFFAASGLYYIENPAFCNGRGLHLPVILNLPPKNAWIARTK